MPIELAAEETGDINCLVQTYAASSQKTDDVRTRAGKTEKCNITEIGKEIGEVNTVSDEYKIRSKFIYML